MPIFNPDINQRVAILEETLPHLIQSLADLTELVQEIVKVVNLPREVLIDYNNKVDAWQAAVDKLN